MEDPLSVSRALFVYPLSPCIHFLFSPLKYCLVNPIHLGLSKLSVLTPSLREAKTAFEFPLPLLWPGDPPCSKLLVVVGLISFAFLLSEVTFCSYVLSVV